MPDLALAAILLLLSALCVLGGLIYHRTRSILYATRRSHQRAKLADKEAADRWLEERARQFLAHILELKTAALPLFGPWVARADFLALIAQHMLASKPRFVVEFGSGASTLVILRCLELNGSGTLVSFEHDAGYAKITGQRAELLGLRPDIRTVELGPAEGYAGLWYRMGELPAEIDCLVVDGPPRTVHPETRDGAAALFDRLSPDGAVFLDDAGRPGEKAIVQRWTLAHPDIDFRYFPTVKGTVIGEKRGSPRRPPEPASDLDGP